MIQQNIRNFIVNDLKEQDTYIHGEYSVTVGRGTSCNIVLNDPKASIEHAVFLKSGKEYNIIDIESSNGIFVNEVKVKVSCKIKEGDVIQIGESYLKATYFNGIIKLDLYKNKIAKKILKPLKKNIKTPGSPYLLKQKKPKNFYRLSDTIANQDLYLINDTEQKKQEEENLGINNKKSSRITAPLLSAIFHVALFSLMIVFLVFPKIIKKVEADTEANIIEERVLEIEEPIEIKEFLVEQNNRTPEAASSMPNIEPHKINTSDISIDVDLESDLTLDTSSFGEGLEKTIGRGLGKGVGNNRGLKGKNIGALGGIKVNAKKLLVILDVSGSMVDYIPKLRREINQNFKEAYVLEIVGCFLGFETANAMLTFLRYEKIDGIYWFSDLQDGIDKNYLADVEKHCLRQKIPFYIRSVGFRAPDILKTFVIKTKGKIKYEGFAREKPRIFNNKFIYAECPRSMKLIKKREELNQKKVLKEYLKLESKENANIDFTIE